VSPSARGSRASACGGARLADRSASWSLGARQRGPRRTRDASIVGPDSPPASTRDAKRKVVESAADLAAGSLIFHTCGDTCGRVHMSCKMGYYSTLAVLPRPLKRLP
jgi:hypothetical protein